MVFETKDTVDGIPARRGWLLPVSMLGDYSKELGSGGRQQREGGGKAGDMEVEASAERDARMRQSWKYLKPVLTLAPSLRLPQFIPRLGLDRKGREAGDRPPVRLRQPFSHTASEHHLAPWPCSCP